MKKLFWGFFFIYLNFNLSFNQFTLNVFPDFVGYYLLLKGIQELDGESSLFRGARPFAGGMMVYTAILWVGTLLGIGSGGVFATVLHLIATAVTLYVSWVLIQGVLDVEQQRNADLEGALLYRRWKLMVAVQAAALVLQLLVDLVGIVIVASLMTVVVLASLILIALFLLTWNRSAKAYERLTQTVEEPEPRETASEPEE